MLDPRVRGEPPGGGGHDPEVVAYLLWAHLLELFALVDDGPAAIAAGAIAWALLLLVDLAER